MSAPEVEYIGPFSQHAVSIDGWRVPWLIAQPIQGGKVHLTCDERWTIWDVPLTEAERWLPFVADCIAVAAGYTCHPRREMDAPRPMTPYGRMIGLAPGGSDV